MAATIEACVPRAATIVKLKSKKKSAAWQTVIGMELLDKRKQTFEFFKFLHIVPYDSTDYSKFHSSCSVTKLCLIFCNPKIVAHQAPSVMGFSRQEYCTGQPLPSPWNLPGPGIKSTSLMSPALAGGFFMTGQSEKTFPPYIPPHSPANEKKKKKVY